VRAPTLYRPGVKQKIAAQSHEKPLSLSQQVNAESRRLVTSSVLLVGNYLVNLAIGISNIPPEAVTLCSDWPPSWRRTTHS
jgi:hypothetical protein